MDKNSSSAETSDTRYLSQISVVKSFEDVAYKVLDLPLLFLELYCRQPDHHTQRTPISHYDAQRKEACPCHLSPVDLLPQE